MTVNFMIKKDNFSQSTKEKTKILSFCGLISQYFHAMGV